MSSDADFATATGMSSDADFATATGNYANTTLYTGRELDVETGLYYYRARYYHAQLGRFISRDPIESGLNLYSYVDNVPTTGRDPRGLMSPALIKILLIPYKKAVKKALEDVKDDLTNIGIQNDVALDYAATLDNHGIYKATNNRTYCEAWNFDLESLEEKLKSIAKSPQATVTYKLDGRVEWWARQKPGADGVNKCTHLDWQYTLKIAITVTPKTPPKKPVTETEVIFSRGGTFMPGKENGDIPL